MVQSHGKFKSRRGDDRRIGKYHRLIEHSFEPMKKKDVLGVGKGQNGGSNDPYPTSRRTTFTSSLGKEYSGVVGLLGGGGGGGWGRGGWLGGGGVRLGG